MIELLETVPIQDAELLLLDRSGEDCFNVDSIEERTIKQICNDPNSETTVLLYVQRAGR